MKSSEFKKLLDRNGINIHINTASTMEPWIEFPMWVYSYDNKFDDWDLPYVRLAQVLFYSAKSKVYRITPDKVLRIL